MSRENDVHVYILAAENGGAHGPVKIGIAGNVAKRVRGIQTSCPYQIKIVHTFAFPERDMAREIERCFHEVQQEHRTVGEWFHLNPIIALQLMVLCIEATFSVRMPNFDEIDLVKRLCGIDAAREKLQGWIAERGTLQ